MAELPPTPPPAPTGRPQHPAADRSTRVTHRTAMTRSQRFENWLRYRSWKVLVVLVLLVLGLANLYPFGWMIGTSLQTTSEAAANRARPYPVFKYGLTEHAREHVPGLIDDIAARTEAAGDDGELTPAQRIELHIRVRHEAMEELTGRQLTRPVAQAGLLAMLHQEDQTRRQRLATFVPYRITLGEFMSNQDIAEPDIAQAAINELIELDLLGRTLIEQENYALVWSELRFYLHFITSLVVTVAVVFITLLMTSMLGYALARLKFPGKMLILGLLIAGAVAPSESIIVPIFRLLQSVGLLEGLLGMTLWLAGIAIGHTFLMAGFFLTLPKEVEEAARIDGAGTFQTFFDVALPMARPIVLTIGLFAFLGAWNEFLIPLLCTMSDPDMQPLAVAVYSFQRGHQGWWPLINSAAAIIIVPVIILFLILHQHIVKAIAVGAVKG
ncbi:MAG: carbohydrate ABC transporter permease [Phycisphaeraceae bacterium]|nr:carbohydrate ABC transporter permease [Phycisphaeraceae bacterium]